MHFSNTLIYWYLQNKRDLPWRKTKNPYAIWLSEIILQQTRINQGLEYYKNFIINFPTVFDLAKADEQSVLKLWQGLGYYSRARNLHYSANYIVNELNGKFPSSYRELLQLKGIGDYTASAIASICYNEATAVVDGNVYRVLSRYFGINTPINSTKGIKEFKELAQQLIDSKQPGTFNQAVMEFGAVQCKPQNPECSSCQLNESCVALKDKKVDILPVKEKKNKIRKRHFNYLVLLNQENKTLLQQRKSKGIWQRLYEFPLIETEKEIDIEELINSKIFNEIVIDSNANISLSNNTPIIHKLSHQHLYTKFWVIDSDQHLNEGILLNEIDQYPVPILIHNFIENFKTKA